MHDRRLYLKRSSAIASVPVLRKPIGLFLLKQPVHAADHSPEGCFLCWAVCKQLGPKLCASFLGCCKVGLFALSKDSRSLHRDILHRGLDKHWEGTYVMEGVVLLCTPQAAGGSGVRI